MKSKDCSKTLLLFDFGTILTGLSKKRCIDALQQIGCGRIAYYVDECRQENLFHELEIGGSVESFCNEARRQSAYTDEMGVFHPCAATNEEICWAWNELLTGIPVEKLRLIHHLRHNLGYRTAILSNTNEIHWTKSVKDHFAVDGLGVDDYFDEIYLSCRLGMVKPDDEIYQEVRRRTDESVENILFIDDSKQNCNAAERNGFIAFHDPKGDKWVKTLEQHLEGYGRAAVIGNFDGVHLGHQYVINQLRTLARERHLVPLAITFDQHPRAVFQTDFHPEFLNTPEERMAMLRLAIDPEGTQEGNDSIHLIHFTNETAGITARDFMQHTLRDKLNVRLLLLGYDNHFGKRTPGEGFEAYREYGKELGIEVVQTDPLDVDSIRISSSGIRAMIKQGHIELANKCLGYPYSITGTVVHGYEEGRRIGFPTANILPPNGKLMPPNGVYESEVVAEGETKVRRSITNIGTRPTFNGSNVTIETNIIGFIGNIYGKVITVSLKRMLRPEMQFESPEALKEQIRKDREMLEQPLTDRKNNR